MRHRPCGYRTLRPAAARGGPTTPPESCASGQVTRSTPTIATLSLADSRQRTCCRSTRRFAVGRGTRYRARPHAVLRRRRRSNRALAAMGEFTDLMSPSFAGHSAGVADLAAAAAARCGLADTDVATVRRAAFVHDVGRVAIPAHIWQKQDAADAGRVGAGPAATRTTPSECCRSPFLSTLASIADSHHERLDGSGYHRGLTAASPTAARADPGSRGRVPGHDPAAAAPPSTHARAERPRCSASRRAPDGSPQMPSLRCWKPPVSPRHVCRGRRD